MSIIPKPVTVKEVLSKINGALSISELTQVYRDNPSYQVALEAQFRSKKEQLNQLVNPKNFSSNGVANSQ